MTLRAIAERLRGARRKAEVVATLMDTLGDFIGADGSGLYEFRPNGGLQLDAAGISPGAVSRYQECLGSGGFSDPLLQAALERSQAVGEQCVSGDAAWRSLYDETARPFGYRHVAIAPIVVLDGGVGALSCLRARGTRAFSDEELARLMSVSLWSSSALTRLARSGGAAPDLSVRQREIVELAVRGLTNGEIAGLLGISLNTVKMHLKEVFLRNGISRRAELAGLLG